jgi:F0F1-type ATP synthase membrane subunit c/vacuolar-type H+-ATPase subunit K
LGTTLSEAGLATGLAMVGCAAAPAVLGAALAEETVKTNKANAGHAVV